MPVKMAATSSNSVDFNYRNVARNASWHSKSKEKASSSALLARKSRILNEWTWNRLWKSSLVFWRLFFPIFAYFYQNNGIMTSLLLPKLAHSRTAQARWFCITWMSSCKGPIGCVRERAGKLANKWCHRYAQMRKIAQYVIQPTRELFVLTEVCCNIIHLFGTAALRT